VDAWPHARAAALLACELARACDAAVRLVEGEAGVGAEGAAALAAWCAERAARGAPISAEGRSVDPSAAMHAGHVLLVVMGMPARVGADHSCLGSLAERALRSATAPVLLVREPDDESALRIRRILLATDFSPAAERALSLSIHWARRLEADLEVLHAIDDDGAPRDYARPRDSATRSGRQRTNALERLRSILSRTGAAGVRAVADLTYGAPASEIVARAARSRADLVVVGRRDDAELAQAPLGRVSERVLRHAGCSVLVAPAERRGRVAERAAAAR